MTRSAIRTTPRRTSAAASGQSVRKATAPTILGPVASLERHLPADWWRDLFGELYLQTDGDVVENADSTREDVDALIRVARLEPEHRILDLCCGQGRHTLELATRGFGKVTGIDQSQYLLSLAKKRAQKAALPVRFRREDARDLSEPAAAYDRVAIMGNSFGYFEAESDDVALLEKVRRTLVPGGLLTLDITDGDWMRANFAPHSWEWIGARQLVCRQREIAQDGARLISREIIIDLGKGVVKDQFYAERLYSRRRIAELLEQAGFEDVRVHDGPGTISDRGQDLGLLQHRMLITAVATDPKVSRLHTETIEARDVVVVTGDPRLSDANKRNGRYNEEDLVVVDRMKEALAQLPGYRISYLNHHATLAQRLSERRGAFVLNLCDEGLNNRADMEAHVPALMESMGIRYTGAGPACLTMCFDKSATSGIARSLGVPCPREVFIPAAGPVPDLSGAVPGIFKPNAADGSFGITADGIVQTVEAANAEIAKRRDRYPGRSWLLQEYLTGDEYSVTLIGNPGDEMRALPIVQFDFSQLPAGEAPIRSYAAKWEIDTAAYTEIVTREATTLTETEKSELAEHSKRLFARLGCRDYARFDFRRGNDGTIRFLEANPNPGWCWDATMIIAGKFAGLEYHDVLDLILKAAIRRHDGAVR